MLAKWITLSRFPLLLISVLILCFGSATLRVAGVGLLFVGLMLDTVDGIVARETGQTSLFGSVLDIAADHNVRAGLPLIIIARTTLTDAFRSIGVGQGTAPSRSIARHWGGSWWLDLDAHRVRRHQDDDVLWPCAGTGVHGLPGRHKSDRGGPVHDGGTPCHSLAGSGVLRLPRLAGDHSIAAQLLGDSDSSAANVLLIGILCLLSVNFPEI